MVLDSVQRSAEAGKRHGYILCRMVKQRVAFPFREDRIRRGNHDAIDPPDLERVVHQFFVADSPKVYIFVGVKTEMTESETRTEVGGPANGMKPDICPFLIF